MADFTTEQQIPVQLGVVDGMNRPVDIDGEPSIAISDPTIVSMAPMTKGSDLKWSGNIVAVGIEGTAHVVITVDADLGDGVENLFGDVTCNVTLDPRTADRKVVVTTGAAVDKT